MKKGVQPAGSSAENQSEKLSHKTNSVWLTADHTGKEKNILIFWNREMNRKCQKKSAHCQGLTLHEQFSFPTHPVSSARYILIPQPLSSQIKEEKLLKTCNMFHPHHPSAASSLTMMFCLFSAFIHQKPEERIKLPWSDSGAVTSRCIWGAWATVGWRGEGGDSHVEQFSNWYHFTHGGQTLSSSQSN